MPDPNLTESAWQRAKEDAAGVYPTTGFQIGGALVTLIVGSVAAVASAGGSTSVQIAVPVLGGAVALGMTFLAVLAFQLAAAPVRQRNELREAWDQGEPDKPFNIELTLRNERRKASGFYRVQQGSFVATSANRKGAEEWTNRVVDLLAEHVSEEAAREFIEAPRNTDGFKPKLDAQTRALDRIISGLEVDRDLE